MNEAELKRQVQRRRAIPDRSWDYLRDKGYVGEALEQPFDNEMVEYLIEHFDELAAASPNERSGRSQAADDAEDRDTVRVSVGDLERERKAALEKST